MCDLALEREVLYEAVVSVGPSGYVTLKQTQCLASLMAQGLQNKSRNNRIAVLHYLIGDAIKDSLGIELVSSRNMTARVASMLIDLLKDPSSWSLSSYGRDLISAAEVEISSKA